MSSYDGDVLPWMGFRVRRGIYISPRTTSMLYTMHGPWGLYAGLSIIIHRSEQALVAVYFYLPLQLKDLTILCTPWKPQGRNRPWKASIFVRIYMQTLYTRSPWLTAPSCMCAIVGSLSVYLDDTLVGSPRRGDSEAQKDCIDTRQDGVWIVPAVSKRLMSTRLEI